MQKELVDVPNVKLNNFRIRDALFGPLSLGLSLSVKPGNSPSPTFKVYYLQIPLPNQSVYEIHAQSECALACGCTCSLSSLKATYYPERKKE